MSDDVESVIAAILDSGADAVSCLRHLDSRVRELEARLEFRLPDGSVSPADGVECRDETIRLQDERIAQLEAALRR